MPLTVEAERRLLAELFRLAADRDAAEQQRQSDYDERGRGAVQEFRDSQQGITRRYHTEKETANREYHTLRHRAETESEGQIAKARSALDNLERRLAKDFSVSNEAIEKDFQDETWEANSIFEAREKGP